MMLKNFKQVCALAVGVAALAPVFAAGTKAAHTRIVLPAAVTPVHYRIDVVPDAAALTFKGRVEIDVTVHQATDRIVLNSAEIAIDSAEVSGEARSPAVSFDTKEETATLALGHKLRPGAYTVSLAYHGRIFQQGSGLFALDYETPKGKARALFTQFENSDARRFVPCWDEPGRKATFELTATVPADDRPVSNMPIVASEVAAGGMKRVRFAASPRMSSYLLYFSSGDFERVHREVSGVDVGVVVKRGDTASAAFALDAAAQILPYYNAYFGTPYPLPKLDLIAGPGNSQFFGAMENWGAIFYFEHDLLIDPRVSTEHDRQNVYFTIAHEMAHQWFGDLVTMAWWDDLWLNEGFAEWMMNKVTDHFHPEWKVWLQVLDATQDAMSVDAKDGTHPVITPINDVMQASAAFDKAITYEKGSAVIRTLEAYVGEDAFRAGVRRYMHDYAYGNTVTDQLWAEIDRGSKRPIRQIAHDLTLQAGVPLVSELSAKCVAGSTLATLAQGHFAVDADSTKSRVWHVPVIAATLGNEPVRTVVAGNGPHPLKLAGCAPLVLNAGRTGYFRSRYTGAGLAAISAQFAALSPYDQLGLFNDTASLAYVGQEPMAALMDLTMHFPADADPVVATAMAARLHGLDQVYLGLPTQAAFRAYARSVLIPILARVGWDKTAGESDNLALLRAEVIGALGDFDDPAVLAEANKRYARFVADAASLDAGTRRTVLHVIARHADAATWDQLHGFARSAHTQLEREEFYHLLGAPKDRALAQRALELSISREPEPTMAPGIITAVADLHRELAFDFAAAHWDAISVLIETSSQALWMPKLATGATDLKLVAKLDAFADANIPASARQDVHKADAAVRYLATVRKDRLPEVDAWVASHGG